MRRYRGSSLVMGLMLQVVILTSQAD
jgi:hypothetical protein